MRSMVKVVKMVILKTAYRIKNIDWCGKRTSGYFNILESFVLKLKFIRYISAVFSSKGSSSLSTISSRLGLPSKQIVVCKIFSLLITIPGDTSRSQGTRPVRNDRKNFYWSTKGFARVLRHNSRRILLKINDTPRLSNGSAFEPSKRRAFLTWCFLLCSISRRLVIFTIPASPSYVFKSEISH